MSEETEHKATFRRIAPVDGTEELLQLDGEPLDFFRSATGIDDVEEMKNHIVVVQRAAYEVRFVSPRERMVD